MNTYEPVKVQGQNNTSAKWTGI